jgi:CRP/FNR family transcriptional regulator, cyclic AMP receptor protein
MIAMQKEQMFELIDKLSFFEKFTEEEKIFLSKMENRILKFVPSDFIIKEGETDYSFFIILKGVVRIAKTIPKEVTITKLKAGSVFGEIACVAKRPRITSVIADGDVIIMQIQTKDIDTLSQTIPHKLKDKLIEILANRLESMNNRSIRNI